MHSADHEYDARWRKTQKHEEQSWLGDGRLVGQGLHRQSYHTQMHTTQHLVFSFFCLSRSSFAGMWPVLTKHLQV